MNIHPIFCSFVAIENNLNFDNYSLEVYCKQQISNSGKEKQSNYLDLNELQPIVKTVTDLSNKISKEIGLKETQIVVRAWANLNNNAAIIQPHAHIKSVFSAVYYVKGAEDSGSITFITPINTLDYVINKEYITKRTEFNTSELSLPPIPGSLIIFPSWLTHYVKSNQSNTERISIAFETNYA
jgi:uncharacterized protein (TIGR02466 family)